MASFIDRVVLHVSAGSGGNGCASIRREKFVPLGGPDGGNGGRGGDVILEVDPGVTTLLDFHFHPHQKAGSGRVGQGSNRHGAAGEDIVLRVPNGTVVLDENGAQLADLVGARTRYVIAHGGRGGLGNAALASTRRRAPGFALLGEPGETRDVTLELKSVADVALVGFPSAGKSSLVSVLSAAKPKIADYPFTTLAPNLGVVDGGDVVYTVADVPGLIAGASEGKGLGLDFLRHVERCAVIVHVLDTATLEPGRDPITDLQVIERELDAYRAGAAELTSRPRLVVLNKIDIPEGRELAELVRPELEAMGYRVFAVSTVAREGLRSLRHALGEIVVAARATEPPPEATRIVLRPPSVGRASFTVRAQDEGYVVEGDKPRRWVQQTDFSNPEAVGYLADRLAKLGVEDQLAQLGAEPGAEVTIGGVTFDWEPTVRAGEAAEADEVAMGPRGSDTRISGSVRLTRGERNARAATRAETEVDWDAAQGASRDAAADDTAADTAGGSAEQTAGFGE